MKKSLLVQFVYLLALLALFVVVKNLVELRYLPILFGGLLGMVLPYTDYLVYAYFSYPSDSVSSEARRLISKKKLVAALNLLLDSQDIKSNLIFHKAYFELLFLLFTYFVISSSGNVFGIGIVLAFSLHFIIDQIVEMVEKKGSDYWFEGLPVNLTSLQKKFFVPAGLILLLLISLVL